jgi:hypothetical protein
MVMVLGFRIKWPKLPRIILRLGIRGVYVSSSISEVKNATNYFLYLKKKKKTYFKVI